MPLLAAFFPGRDRILAAGSCRPGVATVLLIVACLCCGAGLGQSAFAADVSARGWDFAAIGQTATGGRADGDLGGHRTSERLLADGQIREISDRRQISEYCAALDMTLGDCDLLSRIVFTGSGSGDPTWSNAHDADLRDMNVFSDRLVARSPAVASPPVGANDYSCMSLHFAAALPRQTWVVYLFDIKREDGVRLNSRLDEYVAPGETHVPAMALSGGVLENSPFSASYFYRVLSSVRVGVIDIATQLLYSARGDTPVTELKWCYFGANDSGTPGPDDIVVIDALRLIFTTDAVEITDRRQLNEYCSALDMLPHSCIQLSAIVFTASAGAEPLWRVSRSDPAPGGGDGSVISAPIGAEQYSCISMRFAPPISSEVDIFFYWSLGRGGGFEDVRLQLWVSPPDDHVPMKITAGPAIRMVGTGIAAWTTYSIVALEDELRELKWCYFGSNFSPGDEDRGRIDRLVLAVGEVEISARDRIEGYCETLDMSVPDCSRVERIVFARAGPGALIWDDQHSLSPIGRGNILSVASPPTAAGDYSCMSFHLSPPLLPGNQIRFEYSIGEGGSSEASAMGFFVEPGVDHVPEPTVQSFPSFDIDGFDPWLIERLNTVSQRSAELKWCYFGINADPGERDVGRIDELSVDINREEFTARNLLDDYCFALDLPPQHCARLSSILQEDVRPFTEPLWSTGHRTVAPVAGGNEVSIASHSDEFSGVSCLALRFDPPWPVFTDLSFWWDLGYPGGGAPVAAQVLLNHGRGDAFEFDAPAAVRSRADTRTHPGPDFAGWVNYRLVDFPEPLGELKWCHYDAPGLLILKSENIVRLDRLELIPERRVIIAESERIDEYCNALDVVESLCQRIDYVLFARPGAESSAVWSIDPTEGSPGGGGISLVSPQITAGEGACFGLLFEPPWPPYTDLSFWANTSRTGGGELPTVLLLENQGSDYTFEFPDAASGDDGTDSRRYRSSGSSGWENRYWIDPVEPIAGLWWCHYQDPEVNGQNSESRLRIDRLQLTTDSRVVIDARQQIGEYCAALDVAEASCERIRRILFDTRDGAATALWSADRRVASQAVGRAGVSCFGLQFDPPWPPYTDLSFSWNLGHSGGLGQPSAVQVLLNHGAGHSFEFDSTGAVRGGPRTRTYMGPGFTGASRHRWSDFPEPLSTLKWCHYEEPGSGVPQPQSVARISLLEITPDSRVVIDDPQRIGDYCAALDVTEQICQRISYIAFEQPGKQANVVWTAEHAGSSPNGGGISVASRPVGPAAISCLRLQFAPPWPPLTELSFWWDLGHSGEGEAPAAVQLLLNRGLGDAFTFDAAGVVRSGVDIRTHSGPGFAGWANYRRGDLVQPLSELKWCHYQDPGTDMSQPGSIARIDRLEITTETRVFIDDRARIGEYCSALDTAEWICDRIRYILFDGVDDQSTAVWSADLAEGSPDGGDFSVAAVAVDESSYSCMSMYFDPPLTTGSEIRFDWAAGRGGGMARLQLWVDPPADHVPTADSRIPFITYDGGDFAGWSSATAVAADQPVEQLKWCYFGADSSLGPEEVGRIDRLRLTPYSDVITAPDRIEMYCRAAAIPIAECASRIALVAGDEQSTWKVSRSPLFLFVSSPDTRNGQESCMYYDFSNSLPEMPAIRFHVTWIFGFSAPADARFLLYRNEGAQPTLVLGETEGRDSASSTPFWVPYLLDVPNYSLRWCYMSNTLVVDTDNFIIGIIDVDIDRFHSDISVSALAVDDADMPGTEHTGELQVRAELRPMSPAGEPMDWSGRIEEARLIVRSDLDFVQAMSEQGSQQALALELLTMNGVAESTGTVLLPQSRVPRTESFQLFSADGLLLGSTAAVIPVVAADDSEAALNRFCAELLAVGDTASCERLVLPGNGTGDWRISTSSVSVPYIAPPAAADGSCLRLLVGESAESGWVRIGFVWRGPDDSTARLVFHVGDEPSPSRRVATSSGVPAETAVILPLSPEGQLLSWCIEGTLAASKPDVWGLFQPFSVEHIVSEEISDRDRLDRYCLALDLSPQNCLRLSAVVQENGQSFSAAVWDPTHPTVAPSAGGNDVSLASRSDGRVGPSCLALQFAPPWPPFTALSFWWDLGHSGGGDAPAGVQVLLNHGPGDGFEFDTSGDPRSGIRTRIHSERGFAGWSRHRWIAFPEPIAELKWCHYEEPGTEVSRPDSIARIDRLEFSTESHVVIAERSRIDVYCSALDLPESGCGRIGHILFTAAAVDSTAIWDAEHAASSVEGGGVSVASWSAGRSGVSCMALQFAPPWPPYTDLSFWWDLGHSGEGDAPAAVQVLLNHGPGSAFDLDERGYVRAGSHSRIHSGSGFAGWTAQRRVDFAEPLSELRWCHYEESGTGIPRSDSIVRIDRLQLTTDSRVVVSDRRMIDDYCAALNLPRLDCERVRDILFDVAGGEENTVWSVDRAAGSPEGDGVSVASRSAGMAGVSCFGLQFAPPWPPYTDLSFWWDLGHSGEGELLAAVQVLPNHGVGNAFDFDALGNVRGGRGSRTYRGPGFAGWEEHRRVDFSEPLSGLKWCHYEEPGSGVPRPDSIARIDRLQFVVEKRVIIDELEEISEYCVALNVSAAVCERIGFISFDLVGTESSTIWTASHAGAGPGGGDFSVASRSVGMAGASCMGLQFEPPWPPYTDLSFWWDLGHSAEGELPAAVQVLLNHGPGDAFEFAVSGEVRGGIRSRRFEGPGFAGWVPHRWADFAEPLSELKWCHYEEPGTGVPRPESIARIDRLRLTTKTRVVVTAPERLGEYCDALDSPQWLCGRLSRIVLTATGNDSSAAWTVDRTSGSPDGDVDSLVSVAVGAGDYSCMSLYFSPPFAAESAIAFDWAAGGGGRLQLWAPPPADHVPAVAETVPFIATEDSRMAVWSSHSFSVIGEALGELRWCYFGVSSTSGTSSVGRVDRLVVDSNIAALDDRERLAEYCRIMPFAAEDCPQLSRIVFSVSDADDAVWPVVPSSTTQSDVAVVSPAVAAGQEACMRWEFADSRLDGVNALRLALSWQLMEGAADSSLSVVHGGAAHVPRLLAAAGDGASDELLWVPHVPAAPNYWLRFCYRPGGHDAGRMGAAALSRLELWRFRPELNIAPPTADNRLSGPAELSGHRLLLALRLQAVSPAGSERSWGISDAESPLLLLRSRFDFVYTGAEVSLLQPLAVDLLAVGGVAESEAELWLPQSRRAREQYFELLTPNGLLLSSSSLTVPAVAADNSDAVLNRFCARLLAAGDADSCERLVLPGNGTGDWRLSTSSTSVPYIAPLAAANGSCLSLLVGEGSEQGLVRFSFGWRGPNSAVVRLGFHVGDGEQTSRTFAPSLGEPERVAVMLPLRPQGHHLNWCVVAATESTTTAGVWGLFRTLSVLRIVNDPDLEPVLTVDLLIRSLLFEQERLAAGTPPGTVLPDRLPESLSPRSGLPDIPAEEIEGTWNMFYGLTESGRLDVDGNQRYDERDLRLILRYFAGLRGAFLSSNPVDEARLMELLSP